MNKKLIIVACAAAVIVAAVVYGVFFKSYDDGTYTKNGDIKAISKIINKSLEKSTSIVKGKLDTEILEGSYSPMEAPDSISTVFTVDTEKEGANLSFEAVYKRGVKEETVSTETAYEGLYLNTYYPYLQFNEINPKKVDSVKVKRLAEGTRYELAYNQTHESRRMEWAYCDVTKDYEVFLIDENGVIIRYESTAYFNTTDGNKGKSSLNVNLSDYELK